MTVLDPISGKQVAIDLSEKPHKSHGVTLPDEEASLLCRETPAACKPEPDGGTRSQEEPDNC
ncbi:hypothetical protein AB4097_18020 [Microvirga sp. 2MCAF35]|uniref:hypothetical protein n=1 Tax=Microvirga sp. 2MCAF35 TaxID=3232987 RepID=UPI003F990F6F